jgi:6-phosphogluconate dehydrogenase
MELAMIGLGRMGANMAHRLTDAGHRVVGWSRGADAAERAASAGAVAADSLEDAAARLEQRPRVVWLMIPAGAPTAQAIQVLAGTLAEGDIVVDGGNSNFRDSKAHAEALAARGVRFVDCGTSGGIWGYEVGYCLMMGGPREAIEVLAPAFDALAPPDGWLHVGPAGAGHFTKMVHNGIEYALLQAYGEGFEILQKSEFDLDLHAISGLWQHGSVVRSWLLELLERALEEDPTLERTSGYVEDSGEGRWTVFEAINEDVAAPAIALSLMARFSSRNPDAFSMKTIAALRKQFGGHAVRSAG